MKFKELITFIIFLTFNFNVNANAAVPQQITPLQNGDKVLFIGNSFTGWNGPLPDAIQSIIQSSGSNLNVSFTFKTKGLGIFKEYATWSSLGMVDEIRKGGWKYVVLQGWRDAIDYVSGATDELGNAMPNNRNYPENQDTMLYYLKVLDAEIKKVGAVTILYQPHNGRGTYVDDWNKSNECYAKLIKNVSCFYAPVVRSWDSIQAHYPASYIDCTGSTTGSFATFMYHDCGHQNANGIMLDATTFYSIFTGRSAVGLKPSFIANMSRPDLYNEFATIGYRSGKNILQLNNCDVTDTEVPTKPNSLTATNILTDGFSLNWEGSTDNIGVLGYEIYQDGTFIGVSSTPKYNVLGLQPSSTYQIKIRAIDSEGNTSDFTPEIYVNTISAIKIDFSGALMKWEFAGANSLPSISTNDIVDGISRISPSGVASFGSPLITNALTANALNMKINSTKLSLAEAISAGHFFTFSILPGLNTKISINNIQMRAYGWTDLMNFTLMSDVNGFIDGQEIKTIVAELCSKAPSLQSIDVTGHENIDKPITFRVYVWGGTHTANVVGLGSRTVDTSPEDLVISGTVKTKLPAFPTNLTTTNLNETGFTLNWEPSEGAVSYQVFKNGIFVNSTSTLSMNLNDVSIGTTYNMTVNGVTETGALLESSTPLCVKIPDLTLPSIPTGLFVNAITDNSFTVFWDACTDNVGVTLYEIFSNGFLIGNTTVNNLPLPWQEPNTTYSMTVRSKDAAGNVSALSEPISVKTLTTTDVQQQNSNPTLFIYPNPASDFVNINLKTPNSTITVSVLDMLGKTINKSDVYSQNGLFQYNTIALKNGLYLINVTVGNINIKSKLNIRR